MSWARGSLIGFAAAFSLMLALPVWAAPVEEEVQRAEGELEGLQHSPSGVNKSAGDPLSVDPDLAIWTLVVFVVLLIVLKKFAWTPIVTALEKREENIREHISAAERSHDEAKLMLAEYERKLSSAAEEVKAMLEEARRDAEHTKQEILAEAKAGSDAERLRALRDVEAATDAALKQIAQQGANLAIELAGKIVGAKLNAADHSRLIAESVSKMPSASPSRN